MSILYPSAIWVGCLKAKIDNDELRPLVRRTVVEQSLKWIEEHPQVADQLREIQTFHFPDSWIDKA